MPSEGAQSVQLDEADAAVGGQARPDEERHDEAGERGDQRHAARVLAREERDGRADERQHGEQRQNRESGRDSFMAGCSRKNCGERHHGNGQNAQVVLHAAALHARQQAAARGKLLAGLVEAAVDPVHVEQAVELRPEAEESTRPSNDAAPYAAVKPIGDARPPRVEGNHRDTIELVDIEAIAQRGPEPRRGFFERVRLLRLW